MGKLSPIVRFVPLLALLAGGSAFAQEKPNILVIWGDDVGQSNISAYWSVTGRQTSTASPKKA